jgi:hypothetical protein
MAPPLSPEFRLVCAACRWPRGAERDAAVRAAAEGDIDWDRVGMIARRQRVWGLVADGLRAAKVRMPEAFAVMLRERAERIARINLTAASHTADIARMLDEAGIDWITFKGLAFAVQAYGTLTVKTSNDIDIVVPGDQAARTYELFRDAGYRRFNPQPEDVADSEIATWLRITKEVGVKHPDTGLIVEIHSRIMANPALLPQATIDAPRKKVKITPNLEVPTMGDEILFAYLIAHGSHHGWFRLKWLADIAALLGHDAAHIEAKYREAQVLGVGRSAAQALLLANELLALPLSVELKAELRASWIHRRLYRIAMEAMAGHYEAIEHDGVAARSLLPVTLGNWLLRPDLAYKWGELSTLAANPMDRARMQLPWPLAFLYPLMGGFRWSGRILGLRKR